MQRQITCIGIIVTILLASAVLLTAQTERRPRTFPLGSKAQPSPTPPDEEQVETLKIDTNLVTIPVIATDSGGLYVADLRQEEFTVYENDVKQSIAFFAAVSAPFQVVLMLDTSASTGENLRQMQQAALAFVAQLQPADRVKVISFDSEVRDLNEFTNEREQLRTAILKTRSGEGTKLYDAFALALNSIRTLKGRKAIVLFTDGVDYHSDAATFDGTLRGLDEEGVIVYPVRYDTRAQTERIARNQAEDPGMSLPTIGIIRKPAPGTTAPTFPSDDDSTVPTSGSRSRGILGLPSPVEIMRGSRRTNDPGTIDPRTGEPSDRDTAPTIRRPSSPDSRGRTDPSTLPDHRDIGGQPATKQPRRGDDSIGMMLDGLYSTADSYLSDLAAKSGGRLLRADTLGSLPDAFAKIAAELRTQYSLGYYPRNADHDGLYRKIKLVVNRKSVALRTRPGYRAPSN